MTNEIPKKNVMEIQKALEICSGELTGRMWCGDTDCPYKDYKGNNCQAQLMKDAALVLLFQQMQMQACEEDSRMAFKRMHEAEDEAKKLKEDRDKLNQWLVELEKKADTLTDKVLHEAAEKLAKHEIEAFNLATNCNWASLEDLWKKV